MNKKMTPLLFIILGVVIAFPLFSMTYYTMVRTSTPQFCSSCHEIQWAYDTWKMSSHASNPQGFVADCMDCHLPAPQDTMNFFYMKAFHGIKDVIAHMLMDSPQDYDHAENRRKAYASFTNQQCLKCHRNIAYIPDKRGAMLAHKQVIHPLPGMEKRCVECHFDLVHNNRVQYDYKQVGLLAGQ